MGLVLARQPARALQSRFVRRGRQAWDPSRKQIWWSEGQQKWVATMCRTSKVDSKPKITWAHHFMNAEGVGRIFARSRAFADGPFPEFYEPTAEPYRQSVAPRSRLTIRWSNDSKPRTINTPHPRTVTRLSAHDLPPDEHYHYWTKKNNPMNVQFWCRKPFI